MSTPIPVSARTVVLQNHVTPEHPLDLSFTSSGTFAVKDFPIPNPVPEDSLLVRTEDLVTLPPGTPFPAYVALGRVIQVGGKDDQFKVGDIVQVWYVYWADYIVAPKAKAKLLNPIPGASISAYLGALGSSGEIVYWALKGVKPKETDTLIVSGAAGALGCVAVQYAKKVLGVKRVVAIAGTDEKCDWVKSIGADEAVNYKSPTFVRDLEKATPDKADLFLDIVGGSILDEVLMRMKTHGIICEAGAMAMMEKLDHDEPVVLKNFPHILVNRLTLKGFTMNDYLDRDSLDEAGAALSEAAAAGKLVANGEAETVIDVDGQMEKVPIVWNTGANKGKLITKVVGIHYVMM
ncbi:QOR1_2 [Sanghuangporus weigelae]